MAKLIEVITLMSSDEETIPEVDTIETKNGKITVKIGETENLKSHHKQFTSKCKNHTLPSTDSKLSSNDDSSLNLNLNKAASSNSSGIIDQKLSNVKNNQTARKSLNLSKPQNLSQTKLVKEMHLKKQASCTNVTLQNEPDNHIFNHKPSIVAQKKSFVFPKSCPEKEKDVKYIDCENVISCINDLEKKGFDHNVIKSKNIPEKSFQKRKAEEKSDQKLTLSNCSKKRKLSKDTKQMNEFNLDTTKKSDILVLPVSLDGIVQLKEVSSPKFDKCKEKNSISVPHSDRNLKTSNALKANKNTFKNFISNHVIPISSDGIVHLDIGSIQNQCSQVKSLTTDNSESPFKTSKIGDIKKLDGGNAQISFSNNAISNNNSIGEFKEPDIKVKQCSNDLHPKLTITKSLEVQDEPIKDMSYEKKEFVGINNSNCKNKANLEEDKTPQVYFNQHVPLVSSGSTTGKVVEEYGRPNKEKSNRADVSSSSLENQEPLTSSPLPISENDLIPGPSSKTNFTESNKQKFNLAKFNSEERIKLQQLMIKKLESLVESFLNSLEFSNRIDTVYENIKNNPQFVCKLLYEFRKELNAYKKIPEQPLPNDMSLSLQQHNIEASVEKSQKKDFMEELNDNKKQEQSNSSDTSSSLQQHNIEASVEKSEKKDFMQELNDNTKQEQSNSSDTSSSLQQLKINAQHQLLTKSEKNSADIKTNTFNHQKDFPVKDLPTQTKALDMNALGTKNENSLNFNLMNSNNIKKLEEMAKKKLDEKIIQLEKYLEKLDKKIKKLEAKELTLEDMDDDESSFIQEERYKNKFMKTWNLLCRLKKQSTHVGNQMERKIRCEASRFPEINRKVEKFINKQKVAEKFPDYNKIYDIVKSVNEKVQIGLQESDYSRLAKDVFLDVGSMLKRRRINDFEYNIAGFIPENGNLEDDPAEKDEILKVKLENNYEEGKKKLNNILDEYALKQEENKVIEMEDVENDIVSDGGSEDKNNSNDEAEESDVSLEFEPRDIDSNLPETEPSSPVSGLLSPLNNIKTDVAVINIAADSDDSTDPGSKDLSFKEQLSNDVLQYKPTAYHSKPSIESDSSLSDLPSL